MKILGVKIHNISMDEAIKRAYGFLYDSKQHYIVTPNPEIVLYARKNPVFRNILNKSSMSIPDGIGIVWASKILHGKRNIKRRVAGADFMCEFLKHLNKLNSISYISFDKSRSPLRVLFIGGNSNTARQTAEFFRKRFFSIKFYSIKNIYSEKSEFVIKHVIKPSIIFVALGAPKQETWIAGNLKKIPSVKIAMGVGGAFDFVSGRIPRAPKKIQKANMEWLWRLALQPRRLPRIVNAAVVFPLFIFKEKFIHIRFT